MYQELVQPDHDSSPDMTRLLIRIAEGDPRATDELLPMIYDQLKRIASARVTDERRDHTLQATALVHEAYARMMSGGNEAWANRKHF